MKLLFCSHKRRADDPLVFRFTAWQSDANPGQAEWSALSFESRRVPTKSMAGENLHRPSPPFSYVTMKSSNFEFFCARPVLTDSFDQTVRKTVRRFLRPLLHFLLHCPTNCTATDSPLKNFHFQLVADFRGYCQRFFAEVKTAKVIASHRRMCFDVANPFWTTSMGPWK